MEKRRPVFRIKAKLKSPGAKYLKDDWATVWPFDNGNGKGFSVSFNKDAVIDPANYYYTLFECDWDASKKIFSEREISVVGGLDDIE